VRVLRTTRALRSVRPSPLQKCCLVLIQVQEKRANRDMRSTYRARENWHRGGIHDRSVMAALHGAALCWHRHWLARIGAVRWLAVAFACYGYGMPRIRVSTTVDEQLLRNARGAFSTSTDAALLDKALAALLDRQRAAEIDISYKAYDEQPVEEPDAWGDLASFREAASAS
jgi:hypothetical protein